MPITDKEKNRQYQASWKRAYLQTEKGKAYKERQKANKAQWHDKHRAEINAKRRESWVKNRMKVNARQRQYRAKKKANGNPQSSWGGNGSPKSNHIPVIKSYKDFVSGITFRVKQFLGETESHFSYLLESSGRYVAEKRLKIVHLLKIDNP